MHEISIAISIVECVTEESEVRGGLSVTVVHLSLGMLSGVDAQALQFCYKAACQGTFLEGSELVIEAIAVTLYCPVCRMENVATSMRLICEKCNSATQVIRGHELQVASLEVAA